MIITELEYKKEGITMNEKWSEKTIFEKVMDIIAGIAFFVYLIFEALERSNKVESADLITCIAITVVCICEAFSYWNRKRIFSYVAIGGAVCLTAAMVLLLL